MLRKMLVDVRRLTVNPIEKQRLDRLAQKKRAGRFERARRCAGKSSLRVLFSLTKTDRIGGREGEVGNVPWPLP